jgi:general stress protein 26
MEKNLQNSEAQAKLKEIAEDIRICMYCTMQHDSDVASRPMSTAQVAEDGAIWFFSSDNTGAAQQSQGGTEVCLNYASPAKNTYMCVMGTSEVVHDKTKMKELWSDILSTWFPDGLETPGIALLKVTPSSAHYWDSDITRLKILFSYLKAKVTGEPANGSEGTEGSLDV